MHGLSTYNLKTGSPYLKSQGQINKTGKKPVFHGKPVKKSGADVKQVTAKENFNRCWTTKELTQCMANPR